MEPTLAPRKGGKIEQYFVTTGAVVVPSGQHVKAGLPLTLKDFVKKGAEKPEVDAIAETARLMAERAIRPITKEEFDALGGSVVKNVEEETAELKQARTDRLAKMSEQEQLTAGTLDADLPPAAGSVENVPQATGTRTVEPKREYLKQN